MFRHSFCCSEISLSTPRILYREVYSHVCSGRDQKLTRGPTLSGGAAGVDGRGQLRLHLVDLFDHVHDIMLTCDTRWSVDNSHTLMMIVIISYTDVDTLKDWALYVDVVSHDLWLMKTWKMNQLVDSCVTIRRMMQLLLEFVCFVETLLINVKCKFRRHWMGCVCAGGRPARVPHLFIKDNLTAPVVIVWKMFWHCFHARLIGSVQEVMSLPWFTCFKPLSDLFRRTYVRNGVTLKLPVSSRRGDGGCWGFHLI